jgi:hypothetical protein
MIDQVLALLRKGKDYETLHATLVDLLQGRDRLAYENAKLRQENRQLRRRLRDGELRLLRSAHADALLLGALYFSGQYTSRRACQAVMSEHRWMQARALLLLARIHNGKRITAETPEEFERVVAVARKRVEREGLAVLHHRLPLSRQPSG